jgi:hypothetical protein
VGKWWGFTVGWGCGKVVEKGLGEEFWWELGLYCGVWGLDERLVVCLVGLCSGGDVLRDAGIGVIGDFWLWWDGFVGDLDKKFSVVLVLILQSVCKKTSYS